MNDDEPIAQADPESRARTHLANERTFLAWLRTGTGLIALGLGAAQFLTHDVEPGFPLVRILAVTLVLTGIVVTVTGGRRYRGNVRRIERRTFQPAERSIVLSAAAVSLVGLLAIAFIIILRG